MESDKTRNQECSSDGQQQVASLLYVHLPLFMYQYYFRNCALLELYLTHTTSREMHLAQKRDQ
jgi:hypothetical protein